MDNFYSATRLGDLLPVGQLLKACSEVYFWAPIVGQFLKGVNNKFKFSNENCLG